MKRRVLIVLVAVIIVAWLVLLSGPIVRGITLGAVVAALLWYGLAMPNRRGRRGKGGPFL